MKKNPTELNSHLCFHDEWGCQIVLCWVTWSFVSFQNKIYGPWCFYSLEKNRYLRRLFILIFPQLYGHLWSSMGFSIMEGPWLQQRIVLLFLYRSMPWTAWWTSWLCVQVLWILTWPVFILAFILSLLPCPNIWKEPSIPVCIAFTTNSLYSTLENSQWRYLNKRLSIL